jgi:CheY-like chemotaxis protein
MVTAVYAAEPAEERGREVCGREGGSHPVLDATFILTRDGVEVPQSECAPGSVVNDRKYLFSKYVSYAYRIVMARSGLVAVERVKRRRDTDLVVVEYRLPAMSGSDVMKEIKDVAPSILVLIVTVYGDEEVGSRHSGRRPQLSEETQQKEHSTRA